MHVTCLERDMSCEQSDRYSMFYQEIHAIFYGLFGIMHRYHIIINWKDSVKTGFWWVPQCLGEKLECPLKDHFVNSAKTNRNLKLLLLRQYLLNLEQRGLSRCQLTLFK